MKVTLLFIISFSLLQLLQCDRTLVVSADDLQIDTLKLHKIAKHKTVKGKLLTWRDTSKAIMAGQVKYAISTGAEVKKGDTVLFLFNNDLISRPRQKWIDHSAVQSLNKKIELLNTTLKRVESLKHNNIQKLSESDLEQVYVSLENKGTRVTDLSERVNYDEIIKGIRIKIKKIEAQSARYESKLRNNQTNNGSVAFVSKCDGKLDYLVQNEECVKPGEPLFFVNSENGGNLVIKLDQVPNDELQFTVNIKLNDEILNLKLDGLEESSGILRVADEILDHVSDGDNTIQLNFESEPTDKLLIKRSAVHKRGRGYYVFAKRNNRYEAVRVKIGNSRGSKIEILDGLQPNDQIIVSSSQPIWQMSHLEIKK